VPISIFRDNLFAGRVALVTGGGTGIGRGIAEGLAALGASTAILSRKVEHLEPTARAIAERFGLPCAPLVADVRVPDQVEAGVAEALERLGRIDILVNAAAGNFLCAAADLSYNGFGSVVDIDAKGTWNVSKAVYAAWMRSNGGQILNVSATLHYGGTPGQLHVSAAKAAVDALTRNLAVEWGPQGIRVNAIAPGPIADTEGARSLFPGEATAILQSLIPARRLGTIADVVNLALFVLSDAAANINGAILVTDGGLCLAGQSPMAFVPRQQPGM
jgi:2,4-dienoyl-CoA reductase [(3E)-enoyl-CoA-producing], peroxisomal